MNCIKENNVVTNMTVAELLKYLTTKIADVDNDTMKKKKRIHKPIRK